MDFRYILFDVNRYQVEEQYQAANLVSSVFALDQKMSAEELVRRLRKLAGVLKNLGRDEFRQFAAWLSHVFKARLPEPLREKVDRIVSEVNPWEVDVMITNLEITLPGRHAILRVFLTEAYYLVFTFSRCFKR
ncbi:hypothetical protein [Desulfofundulus thermosubterraneus]|uniref:Uncharacterized protein n=1 Tax=Desulfofundulus thermosubterraneus DSM 16057 TaxID=1121432 RepID=A0A1M6JWR2_9FIRM|nr:hypothetical protein [Desulfofundulus thermosubterraneus]SHJ51114.1 hypothetical protein SAMN02745219_02718 [Desulfofundulus thermosubterraneus DSM 16057]